ncbi:MAG: pilus assembly protein PilM, partial [Kiritimatiellae bacterium]|nr:pilus assembly protein PilM [Kiritimatiellia bacterium]
EEVARLILPKEWTTYYAALLTTGSDAVIRYVTLPGHHPETDNLAAQVREHMGIEDGYRVGYVHIKHPNVKTETRLLAAALKEEEAQQMMDRFASGQPAPCSLEISSLAALNAFSEFGPLKNHPDDAVGFIDAGAQTTLMAFFNRGALSIVRKFNMGGDYLVEHIQKEMGVDSEVARNIVCDGSFDISRSVSAVLGPFLRQLSISKDFIERRENCQLAAIYLSGGMSLCGDWSRDIAQAAGVTVQLWNPLEDVTLEEGAVPEELVGQEPRFAAALGAAWGVFQQS